MEMRRRSCWWLLVCGALLSLGSGPGCRTERSPLGPGPVSGMASDATWGPAAAPSSPHAADAPDGPDGPDAPDAPDAPMAASHRRECRVFNHVWDEADNPGGANRCADDCQCDGARACNDAGWCEGEARPPMSCLSPHYLWNEAVNVAGPNRCMNACQCDGKRTCSDAGWCQGVAR